MKSAVGVALTFFLAIAPLAAQDLDQKAWNYVWDRFEDVLKNSSHGKLGPDEIVNVLKFPAPLAVGTTFFAGSIQLQSIAGVIPKRDFSLDPSDQDIRLHDVYRTVLMSLKAPDVSEAQQNRIDAAATAYATAFKAYDTARAAWAARITGELARLKALGQNPTEDDYLRIRDSTSGLIAGESSALDTALNNWQNALPSAWALTAALRAIKAATGGVEDTISSGIWPYLFSEKVNFDSDSCPESTSKGWYELGLTHDLRSQTTRVESWNANGAWSGSFVKIGVDGGKGDFSNVVATEKDGIKLRFCNVRFIPVSAPWFSMEVLRDVDRGVYQQKKDSLIGGKVLGPTGKIPRIVKGLIVARDIQLEAKLDRGRVTELRNSYSVGGGFSIGPFSFGGSSNRTEYHITESNDSGFFGLSSNYGKPIVLAVVLQETASPK